MKCEFGTGEIVFKDPNIAEAMIMMGELNVSPSFFSNMEEFQKTPGYFTFIGSLILKLEKYFDSCSSKKVDGSEINNWEDVLHSGYGHELLKIAGLFISQILGGNKLPKKQ